MSALEFGQYVASPKKNLATASLLVTKLQDNPSGEDVRWHSSISCVWFVLLECRYSHMYILRFMVYMVWQFVLYVGNNSIKLEMF